MRILYLWIKDYKEFKNQEFNLNSKYKFSYDNKNTIICKENDLYLEDFFRTDNKHVVKEITAIVGNNGVGKTTFLELLTKITYLKQKKSLEYILIYQDEEQIKINSTIDNINIYGLNQVVYKDTEDDILRYLKFIYHSNTFDNKIENIQITETVYDISTNNLIIEDNEKRKKIDQDKNYNNVFFQEELKRQMEFIVDNNESTNFLEFSIPKYLIIKFIDFDSHVDKILNLFDTNKKYNQIQRIFDDNNRDGKEILNYIYSSIDFIFSSFNKEYKYSDNLFKIDIVKGVLINILYEIVPMIKINLNKDINYFEYVIEPIYKIKRILEDNYDTLQDCYTYGDYIDIMITLSRQFEELLDGKLNTTEYLSNLLTKINLLNIDSMEKDIYSISLEGESVLREFYNIYTNLVLNQEFMRFSWGLSSGESNLINLFSRLYYVKQYKLKSSEECNNLTILIDEADLGFHPEWQRKYIKTIVDFINYTFEGFEVHIILTTHSPILLSDLPSENILYLSKRNNNAECVNRENKTFGANIYNLYKDNFYFEEKENAINTIGTFAECKVSEVESILEEYKRDKKKLRDKYNLKETYDDINKVNKEKIRLELLEEYEKNKKKLNDDYEDRLKLAYNIINKIGEDVIRQVLLEQYYKICNENEDLGRNKVVGYYDSLTSKEKQFLIEYILKKNKNEVQ